MDRLREAIENRYVLLNLEADSLEAVFRSALSLAAELGSLDSARIDEALQAIEERERLGSTAIGHAVAVPHAYVDCFRRPTLVFVRLARPLNLGAPDGIPTRFVVMLLGPPDSAADHIDTLMHTARLMADEEFRYDAREAGGHVELGAALQRFRERTSAPPAPTPVSYSEGLQWSGRIFGGLLNDVRRRLPYYLSDFRDGMHSKCLGSALFLFFACLAPCVTFGGVMAAKTDFAIGVVEYLVATCIGGAVYALIAGQPLVMIGGTGPLLVFTTILFQLCRQWETPFLPTYAWVGLWTSGFVLALAAVDASVLMRYFTRFTEEIFSGMIALIFIYEAIRSLAEIFQNLDARNHATALLSLLLALGTFYIAMSLSRMRRSHYLRGWMREFLADFGPTIALAAMALVAVQLHEVSLKSLDAPETVATTGGRPWRVDMWAAPVWARWAAAGPALFAAVLVFLDQNITVRLVNSRDHHLQKGEAYHLDLAVVGTLVGVFSMFGLPWLVAATV
ncbi:MAG: PTS sugar transporter subunit IIA [Planctomycetales bacterium]|nr:PTS sugar transporter subunit IIA [Planctomycetales bacterium]